MFNSLLELFLHIDTHLQAFVLAHGWLGYPLLFLIVFCETGLVITPFLPGDSLLFAAGALAGFGAMSITILVPLVCLAAIAGDSVNYTIGHRLGRRFLERPWVRRFVPARYVLRAERFFEKHGAKTIVMARFVPIVRTLVPFLAGVANMPRTTFFTYNIIGGVTWVSTFTLIGYFFGRTAFVQNHFSAIVLAIIVLSLIPFLLELLRRDP